MRKITTIWLATPSAKGDAGQMERQQTIVRETELFEWTPSFRLDHNPIAARTAVQKNLVLSRGHLTLEDDRLAVEDGRCDGSAPMIGNLQPSQLRADRERRLEEAPA